MSSALVLTGLAQAEFGVNPAAQKRLEYTFELRGIYPTYVVPALAHRL